MTKTIKVYEAVLAYNTIKNIIEIDTLNRISPAFKFKLLMILHNALTPIYKEYEYTRQNLIKENGVETKNENGEVIGMQIPENSDTEQKFKNDMKAVQENDVEINFTPITFEELFSVGLDVDNCETLLIIADEYKGE